MDIDIDVKPTLKVKEVFPEVTEASINERGVLKKHNVGYYFQPIPRDSQTGLSAITYKTALQHNFFKIDIIPLSLLEEFESKEQLRDLMHKQPIWELFENRKIVEQLFHLYNNFDVVYQIKPKSVMEVADCLAIIRPGKIKLLKSYLKSKNKDEVRSLLYEKTAPSDLRKSHAIPYAYLIIAQLNLITEKLS